MKKIILAVAFGVLCIPAAQAAQFAFTDQFDLGLDLHTYQWTTGPLVTGTFDATLTGVTFSDITNFKIFVNGVAITQPGRFDSVILSSDGSNDNFYVSYDTSDTASHYGIGSYHDVETADVQSFNYGAGHFEVHAVADTDPGDGAVVEPASWALMLAGFGATGYAMRRRRLAVRFA